MFDYLEVHKLDPRFEWVEIKSGDSKNPSPVVLRLIIGDSHEMTSSFIKRYFAKQELQFDIADPQLHLIEEFFEEAGMARVFFEQGTDSSDLPELFPTNIIHFKYPEKTSFRKSKSVRIQMFLEEAYASMQRRSFEEAYHRLNQVHMLDAGNDMAFELKIVCRRSCKKMAECIPVFEEWIRQHPEQVEPRLGLGEMWLYLEQNQRARDVFAEILKIRSTNCMALVGLAQARVKLSEDPTPELRRAHVLDPDFTREIVEHHFDFRGAAAEDLQPASLMEVASSYQIPLKRVMERARNGVLPMVPPREEGGLFLFSKRDMDRYYDVLKCLGLEIGFQSLATTSEDAEAVQPGLFDNA